MCVLSREEFVQAYLQYVFCSAVGELYAAFSSGFLKVCGGNVLSLFQPSELMAMVVGNNDYNWEEMEKVRLALTLTGNTYIFIFLLSNKPVLKM